MEYFTPLICRLRRTSNSRPKVTIGCDPFGSNLGVIHAYSESSARGHETVLRLGSCIPSKQLHWMACGPSMSGIDESSLTSFVARNEITFF